MKYIYSRSLIDRLMRNNRFWVLIDKNRHKRIEATVLFIRFKVMEITQLWFLKAY